MGSCVDGNAGLSRVCRICKLEKPISLYWAKSTQCKECGKAAMKENYRKNRDTRLAQGRAYALAHKNDRRRYEVKRKFGITPEQYEEMRRKQNGVCAICKKPESDNNKRSLSIDHCHQTGAVRELLCNRCNMTIGRFNDDENILMSAAEYLKRHKRKLDE